MPTLETGQVFERYRIMRWLGSGVSGESYEAEDSMLLRKVTLKLIHPQSTLPDSARRQFFREMQGISALNHPYLAPVLDYGEINGTLYVARKFVSCGSLLGTEGRLWFRPPLSTADAIHYTHQLAQTLNYIHARGYLHGAITFSNILVLRGPNLENEPDYAPFILTDVGLANFVRRFGQQQPPPLPVTAAPEQLGKRVIPASDQFALAVLLYFWLAGRPPYLGTPEEIEHLKLTETITPLSSINTYVTLEQDGMLLRALSVYAEDRYPSILAFADALLRTLPSKDTAKPAKEAARFDGVTAQPAQAATSPAVALENESATSKPAQQEALEAGTAQPLVLENETEQPSAMEPESVPEFGKIPETDPIASFEPLSQIQDQPEQTALPEEDIPQEVVAAESEDEVVAVHPGEQELETPQTATDVEHEIEMPQADQATEIETPQASNEPQSVAEATTPQPPVEPVPQTVPDVPQPLPEKEPVQSLSFARVIISSPYAEQPYEVRLDDDEITIGRAGSSAILLDQDNLTSRHHAHLKREDTRYVLYDMRSANGVYVNGQKIEAEKGYELIDGDHISIGNYELIYRFNMPAVQDASNGNELKPTPDYEVSHLI